jgi:hypothetical protein
MWEKFKQIFCVVFRHSDILDGCFGYMSCARCGQQLGDTLGGAYNNPRCAIVGHNCKHCRKNYAKMGWMDRFLCPNPLKKRKS